MPSIRKGIEGAIADGIIAGFPVVDVKVVVLDGSYHEVDSSDTGVPHLRFFFFFFFFFCFFARCASRRPSAKASADPARAAHEDEI